MEIIAWRFLKFEDKENLSGRFEIMKDSTVQSFRAGDPDENGHCCAYDGGNLSRGDVIIFNKGMNKMIFRTWDGIEDLLSSQKEFSTEDGRIGTIEVGGSSEDMNFLIKRMPDAPRQENTRGQFGEVEKTGVVSAIQDYMDSEKNSSDETT